MDQIAQLQAELQHSARIQVEELLRRSTEDLREQLQEGV